MRARVKRPVEIELNYYNELLQAKKGIFGGFIARMICHEIDHLNGV